MNSGIREIKATPLHASVPFHILKRGVVSCLLLTPNKIDDNGSNTLLILKVGQSLHRCTQFRKRTLFRNDLSSSRTNRHWRHIQAP